MRSAFVFFSKVAVRAANASDSGVEVLFWVKVTVSVNEPVKVVLPSPGPRSAAGTKKVGSAAEIVWTAVVRLPLAEPAWAAIAKVELPLPTESEAPVIVIEPLQVAGSVR